MCANWTTVKTQTRSLTPAEKILSTKPTLQFFQMLKDEFGFRMILLLLVGNLLLKAVAK